MIPGLDRYREKAEPGIWSRPVTRHAREWFGGAFGRNNVIANVGGCVMRKQKLAPLVWDQARGFKICGDWHLYIQIAAGGRIVYDPYAVAYFRQHGRNTSASNFDKLYYYEEHEKILQCLTYNWDIPEATKEGFVESLSFSWNHYGLSATYGDMFSALPGLKGGSGQRREHLVMGSLGLTLGGGELLPIYLANELVCRGYRVSLLCSNLSEINEGIRDRLDARVPVFDATEAKIQGPRAFLDRIGATLVHSHVINIDEIFFKNRVPLENFPYVVTLHGSHQGEGLEIDALLFRMLRRVSRWVYLADRNLDIFKGAPLDFSRFTKIPNAMPADPRPFPQTRKDLGIDEDAVVFTFVARGIQQKGWRAAMEALRLLRRRHPELKVHVLMAGAGARAEEMAASVEPGLPITFLGFQSCINGLYRISDCALAPTRFVGESFPLCIIQALQEGLPVIASRVGEIPAMIARDGEVAGVLIENIRESPVFFEAVYEAMLEMVDPSARARAAEVAREIRPLFVMDRMVRRYLEVYDEAIGPGGLRAPDAAAPVAFS
jgi:glycosyltransferase involved in cell wall biosynthesis